ncbi:MAG: hypothetical protein ACR652_23325 [Methylocystis sp.]|uniref:hypothetical protein n=1 Tax=Methylocystis sp. TaxID=1911079 RepID=UPI003DA37C61
MNVQVFTFPTGVVRQGEVWCEPLKIYFPQIYRVIRKNVSRSSVSPSFNERPVACDFSLFNLKNAVTGSIPVRHLSPSDDRSLIVRHHWSKSLANAYLQGVEDMDSDQPCRGIYETERAIFTIVKCRTRKSWAGPMIFYLADGFVDDSDIGVQIWEKSVGVDGELRASDIFFDED